MKKFNYNLLKEKKWDNEVLNYVAQVQKSRGRQELYLSQKPAVLENLVKLAIIQSTESSNKIECIRTTDARIKNLILKKNKAKKQRRRKNIWLSRCFEYDSRVLRVYSDFCICYSTVS